MAEIKPFRPLRYTHEAGDTKNNVCPPYDIISPSQRAELINHSDYNLIRLELPDGNDKYNNAGKLLKDWIKKGILRRDDSDGIFVYEEEFDVAGKHYVFDGIVCLCKTYDFSDKVVLPHEETLSKAKQDRFDLMCATFCNFSSVYSLYIDEKKYVKSITDKKKSDSPLVCFTDGEGVTHRLWKITDKRDIDALTGFFADKQLFIADGHHRFETAGRFNRYCIEKGIKDADSGFVMMTLVNMDDDGLVIFPTHRLVYGMPVDADTLCEKAAEWFDISTHNDINTIESGLRSHADRHAFVLYTGGGAFRLLVSKDTVGMVEAPGRSDAYRSLDVTVLHTLLLEGVLGIDKENMANQKNLHYTRSISEAISEVDNGDASAAFILNPTKIREIKDVALAGDKMPQKSTYFYPKLITGLVMNQIKEI